MQVGRTLRLRATVTLVTNGPTELTAEGHFRGGHPQGDDAAVQTCIAPSVKCSRLTWRQNFLIALGAMCFWGTRMVS